MPRELLGDRAYHAALRRLGVKNPGDVPVGLPVQLTAKVDDLTHLAMPLDLETYAFTSVEAATVAERSGMALQAGRGGLWVIAQYADDDYVMYRDNVLVLTGLNNVPILPFSGAAAAANLGAIATRFHMTAAAMGIPATAYHVRMSATTKHANMWRAYYIGPGDRIIYVRIADNDPLEISTMFEEVPGPGG